MWTRRIVEKEELPRRGIMEAGEDHGQARWTKPLKGPL